VVMGISGEKQQLREYSRREVHYPASLINGI